MDSWKYYDVIHRYHSLLNPVDDQRLDDLISLLHLSHRSKVVDIGSGKGEMLIRLAEKYRITGVGVDLSPPFVREARRRKKERVPRADLTFLERDGARFRPKASESVDLAMCIGASWIYGGYRNTLKALSQMTKPDGRVLVGEPFWKKTPPRSYLKLEGLSRRSFKTHQGNVRDGKKIGLAPIYALVSSESDWDKYEGLHWYAAREYATLHPRDPDLKELLARDSKYRDAYLNHGRDVLGWAIYLFENRSKQMSRNA